MGADGRLCCHSETFLILLFFDVQMIQFCLTVGGQRTGVQDFFRAELISAGYKRTEPRWYSAQVLAYTGITGRLYQPQNKFFLAPAKRIFSYIAVAEQAGFFCAFTAETIRLQSHAVYRFASSTGSMMMI